MNKQKIPGRFGVALAPALLVLMLGAAGPAQAGGPPAPPAPAQLPVGGNVVAGSATLTSGAATLNIDQSSERAIINWDSFDLGSAARVNFNQPGSDSATLNRVLNGNPSQIFGKITGNGQVFLSNPNGVLFGESASVDVGALTATTGGIADADFMAGHLTFKRDGATGGIENKGELRAAIGGYIALLAPEVRNSGLVIAHIGTVVMASGDVITLNFDGTHLAGITAQPSAVKALIENKSAVLAPGGTIILSAKALDNLQGGVVRNTGTLEATGMSMRGGRIVLEASHRIEHSGSIDASSDSGDGGEVILKSDRQTSFTGSIAARGAGASGNGGFVEVSGKQLDFRGTVNAGSDHGAAGKLLLDPLNIIISDTLGDKELTDADQFGDTPTQDTIIKSSKITDVTNTGTAVTLQANNDITINSSIITLNPNGAGGDMTFQAGRSIILNASIASDGGAVNFIANDPGADSNRVAGTDAIFRNSSLIDTAGGAVSITMGTKGQSGAIDVGQITAGSLSITHNGPTAGAVAGRIDLGETSLTGNLNITASSARNVTNILGSVVVRGTATISIGAGDFTVDRPTTDFTIIGLTAGNVSLRDTNAMQFAATTLSGNLSQISVGPIASTGPVQVAGTTSITATSGGFGYADPYVNLSNASNHFGGAVTFSVNSIGASGTGGSVTVRDSGAINIASSNTVTSLSVTAGGAATFGTTNASTLSVSAGGPVTLGTSVIGGAATITASSGAVDLGTFTAGSDLTVTTAGAIGSANAVTVPGQIKFTAGAANNVTFANANNDFGGLQIVSALDATIVDKNGIVFGHSNVNVNDGVTRASTISGDLSVTAGGDISQTRYNDTNWATLTVSGATTFTANHASAPISLYLGSNDPFNNGGSLNNFIGGVTLARNNTNTGFTNVQLRNVNSGASVLTGLTSVGTLNNVYLRFDAAPSVVLPGMTMTGGFKLYAPGVANTATVPGNTITQTGPIVVAGSTIVAAASTGDIILDNAGNNFGQFGLANTGARNLTLTDLDALVIYAPGYHQSVSGNATITAGGNISDLGNNFDINSGTLTFDAGANDISFGINSNASINTLVITAARNVSINPRNNLILGNITTSGTLNLNSRDNNGLLTQVNGTTVNAGGATSFIDFIQGVTLTQAGNVFGDLAIGNAGPVSLRENDAITQASAWSFYTTNGGTNSARHAVTLTTSNDQAINLGQTGNVFGNLTITQINNGATSAGAVTVRETGDSYFGMTQGGAWTVHGTTLIDGGAYSINFNNANNIFGPMQVLGASGLTNGLSSTVTIYARTSGSADAITDVGGPGAWSAGNGVQASVRLIAYDSTGAVPGGGNINLTNEGNVLGDLYLKATNVTITENSTITDGTSTVWNLQNDMGWVTTGTTNLIVANPTGKSITLDNLTNVIGPLSMNTTGAAGALTSVLITDNSDLTQAAIWNVGTTPVTIDARNHQIDLSSSGNILGAVTINTANGVPTSVALTENDAITQGSPWVLSGVPVTLVAENGNNITLTSATNILGNLTLTGGAVSITENDPIAQGGAWTTTGTTTLNATTSSITLNNAGNVLGALAIGGTPSAVSIVENDDITQASAWVQGGTPFTLNSGLHDIVLSQATNQLGDLTLTAANATVTENHAAGITDGNAWTISGVTTLTAGSANPIVLNANPASDFGTVSIVSASNADISDVNGIVFGATTIAAGGTLTITAGGAITQTGAITAPSLRLTGTGSASLTNVANSVGTLAAGFSGGDLSFTNGGNFAVGVVGGTSGITIGSNDVTLVSATGTVTGLSNVNASSSSLTVTTGTALLLPQMSISGAQTYTASTVSGTGITLNASVTSTAAGAITFNSPVTLNSDLSIQTTNSDITFNSTLAGATNTLTVNAGSGVVAFHGAVSTLGSTGDAGAALSLTSSGATFDSTLSANNGLAITGPVVFKDTVTLADGNAASVFTGLVTLGKAGGMDLSGYDGMTFNGGVLLQNGPATINSNNSALAFQTAGTVSGPYGLTLNSGTQSLVGLDRMGSDLTSLTVTAFNPTIPSGGVTIAGPQTYTATSGSSITLNGNVTSTAAGAITFNSPVIMGVSATVTSDDSDVLFASTIDGARDLTVSSGAGTKTFSGVIGNVTPLGDGTGAALILQGAGAAAFGSAIQARSGITAAGPVSFDGNVTLANGDTGSTFGGLVTSGGGSGNTISGFDGLAFDGGLALTGGPVSIASNGSTLSFGGPVSGAQNLTLNALAGGAGTLSGLEQIGFTSNLTALNLTAQTLSLPATGLAVAGPMSFTAAGGITLNGAVGNSTGPATGQIDFNSPVTLATGAIVVSTANAAVNFNSTVNGAQALTVNAGSGATTFGAAVGATVALASVTTDAGGATAINGGSLRTSGAQTYNDAVTLGADTTLTGVNVQFAGTLNGARALTVNDSGTTTFAGVVGGATPLLSLTTDAAGAVAVNTTAVTTTGAQTYNENMTLGSNVSFSGVGVTFGGAVDGAYTLTAAAGSGALRFIGAVGAVTPLTSIVAGGNTVAAADVTTTGTQAYTANGVTLSGDLTATASNITVTGPVTLGDDVAIATTGGDITFAGAISSINGAHNLVLTAGAGDVVLGGVVGGIAPLAGITVSGFNLTLPGITTIGDANQSYTALNDITLNQSRTLNAPVAFTADADDDGSGSFILLTGVSLTASNNTLTILAADLDLQGNSTLASGSGLMSITASDGRNLALGGSDAPGQMTISGSELSRINSSGGLNLNTTGSGWIHVDGITAVQSQNITGTLGLDAQGTGEVSFINAASTFNALTVNAAGGTTNVGVNLNTTNDPIRFMTPVAVSGASTISSGGGNISFDGTLAVDNDLIISTGNGALTFGGAVGSNKTLTLNLGGGSVVGLDQLQSALTGLTVNATSAITLPALTINGPQVYNTGTITVTGNLGGIGLKFNNVVLMQPSSGTALTLDAGAGTLDFTNLVSFNATDMTLTADEIDVAAAVTGTGSLVIQPATGSRDVAIGSAGAPITGLNLSAAEVARLPIGTVSSLTIGRAAGTGSLELAGTLAAAGRPVTLNGGGGITQTGGSLSSGALSLYAAGNAISLTNAANAFGAVGISGTPTALSLRNTLAISQLGSNAWVLGNGAVTLNAGTQAITLNNAGNTFGTLALTGGTVQVTEAAASDIGASTVGALTLTSDGAVSVSGALTAAGNVSLTSTGVVTQSAPLTIGGDLSVVTTVNAGDVTIDNSGASATTLGDTLVGGNYVLIATGDPVSQGSGASLQVRGDLTITGSSIVLGGAGNLIGGTTSLPATDTVEVRQSGVITLGDRNDTGNLTVISERTNRSFGGAQVTGDAIVLDNAANNIGGRISVSASAPTVVTGADVQTGINQTPGTSITVAGVASFTAEASSAGSLGIDLTNAGNTFGVLQLSGTIVNVRNSAPVLTTIASALASTSLTLTTAGGVAQTGTVAAPTLIIDANGGVTLNNIANDVGSLTVDSGGGAVSFVDANALLVAGIDAGGANVSLTAGGSGDLTQTGALLNVGALTANAGGAVTLTNGGNTLGSLAASTAGTGLQIYDSAGGLQVSGAVRTTAGDMLVRTVGDLTLNSGGSLEAIAGNLIASTEGAGNFINNSGASALVVGGGNRWLVYSSTPDLVSGAHTVKGGLTSSFRQYGSTYATYAPGSVTQNGNGFIYADAAPTLTVNAAISGAASHVYGDTPSGTLTYIVSSGLVDSEDNATNIVTGGVATYSAALSDTMNAGSYNILYTGGLTSNYTLIADTTGATYTVTPAVLTYVADPVSRVYGAANPASLTGTITGFKLGQDASVLGGAASWSTTATSGSNAGQYAITGSGYSASNYTFAQATGNATAFTITRAGLTVTVNNDARTYDGTAYSGGAGVSYGAFANGDDASDLGGAIVYGGTAQGARNAGSYSIGASGLTSDNYDISYIDGSLSIARANLALTANDITKTYDGALNAVGTATVTGGTQLFSTDSLSGGTFAFTNANAGTGNKTVTVSGVTVNDGNGGGNYDVSYVDNTTSTINPASITVAANNITKTYDGTLSATGTAALVSGTLFNNASNGNAQDSLGGGTFAFTNANAGSGNKTVTASGVTVNDGNGGGNYIVSYADNTTSTIDRATLTFNGAVATREYDGTTAGTLSGYTLTGFVGSETVTATAGSVTFSDKNAGAGKTVNIGGIALADGVNGGLASNYTVNATSTSTGTIDPKLLTINANVDDKVYDGTTAAVLQNFELSGFVGTETVSGVLTGTASFADKNVGTDKAIAITGITLVNGANGGLATNYAAPTTANGSADITPATLHVAGVIAMDKVYDGTLVANLNTGAAVLAGKFGSDDVQIGSITGTFLTKDVGTNKQIGAGTVVMSGADAGNYILVQPTGLTASITPRSLTVSATGVDKVYDGTTAATVNLADNRIAGDVLTIASTSAFLDKNAGAGKYVGVSGIAISGADAGNYTVNSTAGTSATIAKANLAVIATGVNKVYDGTTAATVTLAGAPLAGDDLSLSYGSAAFANKNAGTGKTVNVNGISASGADAGNYTVASTTTATANIAQATLTVGATGQSKVYDGTTDAQVTLTDNRIAGDQLSLTESGASFADAEVGEDKTITITGIQIAGGADGGNYVLGNTTASAIADIVGDETPEPPVVDGFFGRYPIIPQPRIPMAPVQPSVLLDLALPAPIAGASTDAESDTAEQKKGR